MANNINEENARYLSKLLLRGAAYTIKDEWGRAEIDSFKKSLEGDTYDFSSNFDILKALADVIRNFAGIITNDPTEGEGGGGTGGLDFSLRYSIATKTPTTKYELPSSAFNIVYTEGGADYTITSASGVAIEVVGSQVLLRDLVNTGTYGANSNFAIYNLDGTYNSHASEIEALTFNGSSTAPDLTISANPIELDDRAINVVPISTDYGAISFTLPDGIANKSRDFYVAIACDTTPPEITISGATLQNAKGESPNLSIEEDKVTVLRLTEIKNGTASPLVDPIFLVTGGANGGIDNTKANSTAIAPNWRAGGVDTAYAVNDYITYNGNAYVCMVAYTATSSSPTPNNDIYNDTVTPATGHWQVTDMTTPDATLDITSQGSLRVVSAGGQTLWQQGYALKATSSATLANEAVNKYDFAANATAEVSLMLPTAPTNKVGDFILDVTNPALDTTAANFPAEYDSTAAYSVGDTCSKDSKIYRCITAIASGGETWTAVHWEEAWPYFSIAGLLTTVEMVVPEGENLSEILTFAPGTMCELYFTCTSFAANSKPTWKVVRQDVELYTGSAS